MLTTAFAGAIAKAENIIASAPHVQSEQDLIEGYDYLAGSIRAALQMAWAYELNFPYFVQSPGRTRRWAWTTPIPCTSTRTCADIVLAARTKARLTAVAEQVKAAGRRTGTGWRTSG